MQEINRIDNHLFLGNRMVSQNHNILNEHRFDRILTVGTIPISETVRLQSIKYLFICAEDHEKEDLLSYFPKCYRFINKSIKKNRNVLIQFDYNKCMSLTIICSFLMKKYRKSLYVTLLLVNKMANNPINDFNNEFQMQLILYNEMNYILDGSKQKMRLYLLNKCINELKSSQIQDYTLVLLSYLRKVSKAEQNVELIKTSKYYCIYCEKYLFSDKNVIEKRDDIECHSLYIEPRKWMTKSLENLEQESSVHVIKCDKCDHILGKFDVINKFECKCSLHKSFEDYLVFRIHRFNINLKKPEPITYFLKLLSIIDSWIISIRQRLQALSNTIES